jgi:hypothetical protein
MLVKRTNWMKKLETRRFGETETGFISYHSLYLCLEGLQKFWRIPKNARWVRFYLFDTPTEKSVSVKMINITTPWDIDSFYYFSRGSKRILVESNHVSSKVLDSLFDRQKQAYRKTYHVECEYSQ